MNGSVKDLKELIALVDSKHKAVVIEYDDFITISYDGVHSIEDAIFDDQSFDHPKLGSLPYCKDIYFWYFWVELLNILDQNNIEYDMDWSNEVEIVIHK